MKKGTSTTPRVTKDSREDRINRELSRMRHRELQMACILRGLAFEKIVEFDHHQLVSWFFENYENPEVLERLPLYDVWIEKQLENRGYKKGDAILAPCFRFSYIPDMEEVGKITTPGVTTQRVQTKEPNQSGTPQSAPKPKKVVNAATGVYAGTKKNLTYELTQAGLPYDQIVEQVLERFPEAQEKSIKIWHKRCLKEKKQ